MIFSTDCPLCIALPLMASHPSCQRRARMIFVKPSIGSLLLPELHKTPYHCPQDPVWTGPYMCLQFIWSYSSPPSLFSRHTSFCFPINMCSLRTWHFLFLPLEAAFPWIVLPRFLLLEISMQMETPQRRLPWLPKFINYPPSLLLYYVIWSSSWPTLLPETI